MAAFTRERAVSLSIPIKARLAETRPCRDECAVANGCLTTSVEHHEIFRREGRDAVGLRLEVVDDRRRLYSRGGRQLQGLDHPRQIRGLSPAFLDGAGDAEASPLGLDAMSLHEALDDFFKRRVLAAGEGLGHFLFASRQLDLEDRQPGVGATHVSGEHQHQSLLQRRPSRLMNWPAAFGPQVPAA